MKSRHLFCFCVLTALMLPTSPAMAWWPAGHKILTRAAVLDLPPTLPEFFRHGADLLANCSEDPDVVKNPAAPHVDNAETPEHFLDYELLHGHNLPPTRYEFIQMCAELHERPERVGLLPYAIVEGTERLTIAFAEQRKWPDNKDIQIKCLIYAGLLAHYAEDACQPLHLTVDFDGRALPGGASPRSGIHAKVDALIQTAGLQPQTIAGPAVVTEPADDLMAAVWHEIETGRGLIDRVYALEAELPAADGGGPVTPAVKEFALKRARESARFTALLYVTAWTKSAAVELPAWLDPNQ